MANRTFTSDHSRSQVYARTGWIDKLWLVGLFVCAILLYGINLGNLPIVDLGNEGTVAQIAREIYQSFPLSNKWIYPTLWGEPYINHPPFLYVLIAIAYHFGGVNEWTIRLPSALLSALSVPLLYLIGKEIFTVRLPALLAAFIYLTSLPILHYGRLAIIDSAVLCFFLLMMWCVLRSRRDLRFALGIGISLGLICLTKGLEGLLLSLVGLIFLIWDTPRLLTSVYLWTGIIIGSAPISAWYWSQWLKYKQLLLLDMIKDLEWLKFGIHFSSFWYYLLAIFSPFFLFVKKGLSYGLDNHNLSRGKLVITWLITSMIAVVLMPTKEAGFLLPIYPGIALAIGGYLGSIPNLPGTKSYPKIQALCLFFLGVITLVFSVYSFNSPSIDLYIKLVLIACTITFFVSAKLITQRDIQFIHILIWGNYVALILLMMSPYAIWNINQSYQVQNVALMLEKNSPTNVKIYTSFPADRPALNFYSKRQVIAISPDQIKEYWEQNDQDYFLLEERELKQLNLLSYKEVAKIDTPKPDVMILVLVTHEDT